MIRCLERERLQNHLKESGIGTLIHYPVPPHMQKAFAGLDIEADSLPLARELSEQTISLPVGPHLDNEKLSYIIRKIIEFL